MRRLLIADGSQAFVDALSAALQDSYEVMTCCDGDQALELLRVFRPELLVLDLQMPGTEGLSVLSEASRSGCKPVTLALTRLLTDYVQTALDRSGAAYVILKPCNIRCIAERLRDMEHTLLQGGTGTWDESAEANSILLSLGFRTDRSGYRCTLESIVAICRDPEMSISKGVYPAVVPICGTSAAQVEHAIRLSIQDAWKCHDEKAWAAYFPKGRDGKVRRPTNAVFLTRIAASLRQGRR